MKTALKYDDAFMRVKSSELRLLSKRLSVACSAVMKRSESGEQGWLTCIDDAEMIRRITRLVNKKKKKFRRCLVIGIGGSDLSARALYKALRSVRLPAERELFFAGANTDPDELGELLRTVDLKDTLVNIISKSGDTIEPMATFFIVRERLEKMVGKNRAAEQIVATTDESSGSLRALAEREGYDTLPVPKNIGGRFSGLTDVGLFPLAYAGIDIRAILNGARIQRNNFLKKNATHAAVRFAALQFLSDVKHRRTIHVLMPYSEHLCEFGFWYRQLWAESLGKEGKGPTPIAALGATDQHSQLQLYQDGPRNKTVTFVEVETFSEKIRIPIQARDVESLAFLAKRPLEDVLHAERLATARALHNAGQPNGTVFLRSITPSVLGELCMFFELAVAIAGELYAVNAYDQPGVEASKRAMYHILNDV